MKKFCNFIENHISFLQGLFDLMDAGPAEGIFAAMILLGNVVVLGGIIAVAQELLKMIF